MNLMLLTMLGAIGVGLFARQIAGRQRWLVAGLAVLMTALYWFHPQYM